MTFQVVVQPKAEQDIQRAAQYILDQSRSAATALRWVRDIRATLDTLYSFSGMQ